MAQRDVYIVSGTDTIPSADELITSLRKWLHDAAHIRGEMQHNDIVDLHINATGFTVDIDRAVALESPFEPIPETDITHLASAVLHRIRIIAEPATVLGCPLSVNMQLRNVDIDWIRTNDGRIGFTFTETGPEMPELILDASAPRMRFEKLLIQGAHIALFRAEPKLKLLRPHIAFNNYRNNGVEMFGKAIIKYGLFRLKIGMRIRVRIKRNFVLSIDTVSLKGSNLLLRMWERKILKDVPKTITLPDYLPAGLELKRFDIAAGDRLKLQVETVRSRQR